MKDNIELPVSVTKYLNSLKYERKLSINTIESYTSNLKKYVSFIAKDPISATSDDVLKYLKSEYVMKDTTIAHYFTAIHNYYRFLVENNYLKENPCESLYMPKVSTNIPKFLTYEEVDRLLDVPLNTPYDYRTKAMFELLYATGIRISELINLRFSNLDLNNDLIRVEGKGSKERVVPINETSKKYLLLYLNDYRNLLIKPNKINDYIFLNNLGTKISRVGVFKLIKSEAIRANIKKDVSPHVFRHSFATHLLNNGANLRVIQELLGHSSISTTQVYTHVTDSHLRSEYNDTHPRS